MDTKNRKRIQLRNNEYYNIQAVFDQLYENARNGAKFTNLIGVVTSAENIKLAYRNIKNNKGSKTKGTDGKTISDYESMNENEMIEYFQSKIRNYYPKSVRRVEIPKPNGKMRPLGIPCMEDRIIQQCLKQVLEPICEAKFFNHSYGFRPNRSTRHAIARYSFMVNIIHLYYVVDVDIKGFFDNVNHAKLMKQLWTLGIRDKNILCIISKIIKSEIEGIGIAERGVPQGGIISPLLANVVLNELDWWIAEQWECIPTKHSYGSGNHKYRALRNTALKEMYIVRYADDFKIVCSNPKTAEKVLTATKMWLKERLGLEVSEEKTKITYLKKNSSEFLGIKFKAVKKGNKFVARSHMTDKNVKKVAENLKKQIINIQHHTVENEVVKLNKIILGVHNYYSMATMCNFDFHDIYFLVNPIMNRLKKNYTRGKPTSAIYLKLYGKYQTNIYNIAGIDIFPIYGICLKKTTSFKQEICNYTKEGRNLIHSNLSKDLHILVDFLLANRDDAETAKFNDNRISKLAGQNGKSYISGADLCESNMACIRMKPKERGGKDDYDNIAWITKQEREAIVVKIVSEDMVKRLELSEKAKKKLNSLRVLVGNLPVE
ncbi:group II intron reverse transcriptase/maturase [Eubacterium nodatum ATCC 33099]|nr:group II intron reverse transcriptase/maturase [Eubacterium nodatum ATCC 33099]